MKATKPIPDDLTILSIPIDATKRGNDLRVKTLSVLKEEDGSILLLKSREDNNIWWKVRDNTPKEVDSISIDPDFCLFLKCSLFLLHKGKGKSLFPFNYVGPE